LTREAERLKNDIHRTWIWYTGYSSMVIVGVATKRKSGLLLKERIEKKGCHMRGLLDTTNINNRRLDIKPMGDYYT